MTNKEKIKTLNEHALAYFIIKTSKEVAMGYTDTLTGFTNWLKEEINEAQWDYLLEGISDIEEE